MSDPGLFAASVVRPLADRLRPERLADVIGQDHLLGADGPIARMIAANALQSMVLWGPPGCGKTTIAGLIAHAVDLEFVAISALQSGAADLRRVFAAARARRGAGGGTVLFCDEVHHFNRTTQDLLLPHIEDGTITLVGATTQNPSFELNGALLSRLQVFVLRPLDEAALGALLARAEAQAGQPLPLSPEARVALLGMAEGDGRALLNWVEQLQAGGEQPALDVAALGRLLQRRLPAYDKSGEAHFNLLSAFHKSLRGSDADAALYWMCRMLAGGEDPKTIARRMLCVASEDVGLADPNAINQALAAWEAYERLGAAEGERALAQACLYLATAPKSNAVEAALGRARRLARETAGAMPPMHAMNAPTGMMRALGYGAGYVYDHDTPEGFSGLDFFPPEVGRSALYQPVERGFERDIRKRLSYWSDLRKDRA